MENLYIDGEVLIFEGFKKKKKLDDLTLTLFQVY